MNVLVEKLHKYLQPHNLRTGIDITKENFPDKPWLIIAVASVSSGKDEIFGRDYIPSREELLKNPPNRVMVHNNDGLLDIPSGLAAQYQKKGSGHYIKMVTLTKEDKIRAQIILSEQKMQTHIEKQKRLAKELEKAEKAAQGIKQRDIELSEMRAELERIIHQQAQDFITQTVAEKEAAIRKEFEQQLEQRLASQSVALVNNVNVDMRDENENTANMMEEPSELYSRNKMRMRN